MGKTRRVAQALLFVAACLVHAQASARERTTPPGSDGNAVHPGGDEARRASSTRVVVLGSHPEFAARVKGHTSDLDAEVVTRVQPISGGWSTQIALAKDTARSTEGSLVVWLTEMTTVPGSGHTTAARTFVAMLLTDTDRFYARALGRPLTRAPSEDASATFELGALSVRAALQALSDPEPALGVPVLEISPPPSREPAVGRERPRPVTKQEPAPTTDASQRLNGVFQGTAVMQADAVTALGLPALRAGLGLNRRGFRALVSAEWGLPRERVTQDAVLRIERFGVDLEAQLALTDPERTLTSYAAIALGAVAFHRATEVRTSLATPTPPATLWSPLAAGALTLEWAPFAEAREHRLTLRAGASFVPGAPVIEIVETGTNRARRYPLALLQPSAALQWATLF